MSVELDEIRRLLEVAGLKITTEQRLGNETGTQIRLTNKAIVNIFDNGNISVQGRNIDTVKKVLGMDIQDNTETAKHVVKRKVFVVYGHDPG